MLIKTKTPIKSSEITPEETYVKRRTFMRYTLASAGIALINNSALFANTGKENYAALSFSKNSRYSTKEKLNSWSDITTYNNFYEFGTAKSDPAEYAGQMKTKPWKVKIDGLCEKPGNYDVDELIKENQLEERIYRLRCVEAWSMVVPWIGIPLHKIIKKAQPTSKAKYVEFVTLNDAKQMPGLNRNIIPWPYTEGLRMDEALHPLTLLSVGLYGKVLPNQNGAPIRLVVPWKYGFKSIKSIVQIRFKEKMPFTSWNKAAPSEYGFFANVNPQVDHPRWSQARERRLGSFFKIDTEMFNGYAEEVGPMYSTLNLKKWF